MLCRCWLQYSQKAMKLFALEAAAVSVPIKQQLPGANGGFYDDDCCIVKVSEGGVFGDHKMLANN